MLNRAIVKNTTFLYLRTFVTMIISLYTSRVILKYLGVDDYGIYQAVGGIVGFMSFVNNALATGSGRFITYALGTGDREKVRMTYSTVTIVHLLLAVLIVVLAETVGLWFFNNKMVIPAGKMVAAQWVFHLSIVTAAINITQAPFSGVITSHEKFSVYAYVSVFEAVLKLGIAFMLVCWDADKLILYAILCLAAQIIIRMTYQIYCRINFEECRSRLHFDAGLFKPIAEFSSWNLLSQVAMALNNQGVLVLLNLFFSPAVVSARALSLQVDGAIKQFVSNFRTASNPQIVKIYASGEQIESRELTLQTAKLSFSLMLILCVPTCMAAEPLLNIWLEEVPDFTVIFLQLIVIQNLFATLDNSFFSAFYANGRLKENAIYPPLVNLLRFIFIFVLFKGGSSPVVLSIAGIVVSMFLSLYVKPLLMVRLLGFEWKSIIVNVFIPCFKAAIPAFALSFPIKLLVEGNCNSNFFSILLAGGSAFLISVFSVYFLSCDKETKKYINTRVAGLVKKQ